MKAEIVQTFYFFEKSCIPYAALMT